MPRRTKPEAKSLTQVSVDGRIESCHNPFMPNRSSTEPETEQPEKNPAAVPLGRMGGLKGGKARAAKLSPAKRKAIAKKAAQARWRNKV